MNTTEEKLLENFKNSLQNFLRTESFDKIKQANIWLAEQLQNATLENICLGERPKFQRFYFTGSVSGIVSTLSGVDIRVFCQLFSGHRWLLVDEDESILTCCEENKYIIKNFLQLSWKEEISTIKDKADVALQVATDEADHCQCGNYLHLRITNERLINYTASEEGDLKEIPIRPIYVVAPAKKKIFIGTFFEETQKVEIEIYDTNNQHNRRINNIRQELDYVCKLFKKMSKKSSKKVAKICIPILVIVVLGLIGYFIYLLVT